MKQQAFIYKASGDIIPVLPANGIEFTLKEMQSFVKGHIELVFLKNNEIMVVNEEGKLFNLRVNEEGTKVYNASHNFTDIIHGDVLVTPAQYIK